MKTGIGALKMRESRVTRSPEINHAITFFSREGCGRKAWAERGGALPDNYTQGVQSFMSLRPTQSSRGHDAGSHSNQASPPVAAGTAVSHVSGGASQQAGKDAGTAPSGPLPATAGNKKRECLTSVGIIS